MIVNLRTFFKAIFFLLLIVIIFSGVTSADIFDTEIIGNHKFSATTLDFSLVDTASNLPSSTLFNVSGLIPSGFEVIGVRTKKEGKTDFNYRIKTVKTAGSDNFCKALQLTVLQNWQIRYQGDLLPFSLDSNIKNNGLDDWIFYLVFFNNDKELINNVCDFNFVFNTYREGTPKDNGLFDEEIYFNHVSSGVWSVN